MNGDKKSVVNPLVALLVALLVAGGGGTYYFYSQYQKAQTTLKQTQEAQQQVDVQALVDEVGNLIELPEGETPTVATIRSTENLADHPFLSKGQVGDRLLIYTGESRLVVMYRPSSKKIIAVGSVTISETPEGGVPGGTAPAPSPTE